MGGLFSSDPAPTSRPATTSRPSSYSQITKRQYLDEDQLRREVAEYRQKQAKSDPEEMCWPKSFFDKRKAELETFKLCRPETHFAENIVSDLVTLSEFRRMRILIAGMVRHGKSAALNTIFQNMGCSGEISEYEMAEGDVLISDHELVTERCDGSLFFVNIKGFKGEMETDSIMLDALITGRLASGSKGDNEDAEEMDKDLPDQSLAVIVVIDGKWTAGEGGFAEAIKQYALMRKTIQERGLVPITLVSHLWDESTNSLRADFPMLLKQAEEVVGSAPCHVFPFENKEPKGDVAGRHRQQRRDVFLAVQESIVQACHRLNRMELHELRSTHHSQGNRKYAAMAFILYIAAKYSWNPLRTEQFVANVKERWLGEKPEGRFVKTFSPEDFRTICLEEPTPARPSVFLSKGMEVQVLNEIREYTGSLFDNAGGKKS